MFILSFLDTEDFTNKFSTQQWLVMLYWGLFCWKCVFGWLCTLLEFCLYLFYLKKNKIKNNNVSLFFVFFEGLKKKRKKTGKT